MTHSKPPALRLALMVEDDPVFQRVLAEAIAGLGTPWMTQAFRRGDDAIAFCRAGGLCPDLALVDLGLPDCSGVEVIRGLAQRCPDTPVMVVSIFADEARVLEAIRAGALGYLLKDDPSLLITQAIEQLLAGVYPISPMLARYLFKLAGREPSAHETTTSLLTPREHELLAQIAEGHTYAECAAAMGISLASVQTHVRNLYRKLGAHSQVQAVKRAQQQGLL
ncbi:MAG: response regulator transcription factor [Sphingobacteriia bacterium]|nr:response regulator transcription factor [Sphingobacteriia bacterium]NCC41518.1 response regulator transcription factor [Gammaproteobacteria bacterium]